MDVIDNIKHNTRIINIAIIHFIYIKNHSNLQPNYDVELLWSSNRPFILKQRIDGDYGHMSNETSAVLLANIIGENTRFVVRAHISHDCNYYHTPELITHIHDKIYQEFGLDTSKIHFVNGSREKVTGVFVI